MFTKKAFIFIILLSCFSIINAQSYQDEINSLKEEIYANPTSRQHVDLLNDITYAFRRVSTDSMQVYSEQVFQLLEDLDYPKGLAMAYKNRGIIKFKLGGYYTSIIEDYQSAIDIAETIQETYIQAACYNNIALVYQSVFQLQKALEYFFKANELYESDQLPNDKLKGMIYGNIGTAYHRLNDYEKEYEYLDKVLNYAEEFNLPSIFSIYCDNFAKALINRGEFREAIVQAEKGIKIQKEIGDNQSYIQTLHTLSLAYLNLGEYDKGLDLARESIEVGERFSYGLTITEGYTIMIQLYREKGDYPKAIEQGLIGYEHVLETNNFEEGVVITQLLSELFELTGDDSQALFYIKEYNRLNKESFELTSQMVASRMEARYQNQLKEKEILVLNAEKEVQQKQSLFLLVLTLLLSSLLIYTYISNLKKQKTRKELEYKNKRLALAEIDLAEKNDELKKYIESNIQLEQFAHVASHDLKSPLRTISSFTGLLRSRVFPKLNDDEKEYFQFIENGAKQMSGLVNDLLEYSRANSQEINTTLLNPKRLVERVIQNIQVNIEESESEILILDMPTEIIADEVKLKRVFQNLISNAIKFVKPNETPKISIKGEFRDEAYHFAVSDNGIGIESKYIDKIFLPYNRLNAKVDYDGTGMGLAICKKLVEQHNGTISVASNENGGTVVSFSISAALTQTA